MDSDDVVPDTTQKKTPDLKGRNGKKGKKLTQKQLKQKVGILEVQDFYASDEDNEFSKRMQFLARAAEKASHIQCGKSKQTISTYSI